MDAERLRRLGFDLSSGYIYRNNQRWGSFTNRDIFLTEEGEELVDRLEAGDDPAAPPPPVEVKPKPKGGLARKPKAPDTPSAADLNADLASLGSLLNE